MNQNNTSVIWTMIICSAVLLILGFVGVNSIGNKIVTSNENAPTSEGVANAVLAGLVIPAGLTAEDIAALVPDQYVTGPQVEDDKKQIAYDLVLEEMEDDDFREAVMNRINFGPGSINDSQRSIDKEEHMVFVIKDLDEVETEVVINDTDEEKAWVTLEFKVYFLEDGEDDECGKARMQIKFEVTGLDRDNNYEDAEVTVPGYLTLEIRKDAAPYYCSYM